MDTIKEKFVNLYIDSLTDEEQKSEFGIAKSDFISMEMKSIKQMRFKAKAMLGRMKAEAAMANIKDRIVAACSRSLSFQELLLQRYPAVNFRKLETLTESDLKQLTEDMEIINYIEELENVEQGTDEGCRTT